MFFYFVTPLILIASSSLGLLINPSWSVSPFIWVFILVPIIDLVLPYLSKQDADLWENVLHNFLGSGWVGSRNFKSFLDLKNLAENFGIKFISINQ